MGYDIVIPSGEALSVPTQTYVAPVGPPWTPADTSVEAWYDASNTDSITHISGAVSAWNDLSGKNRHMEQTIEGDKPNTGTNTLNGLNVINSDQDWMNASVPIGEFPTSIQITGVLKKTGTNNTYETFVTRSLGNYPAPLDVYNNRRFVGSGASFKSASSTDIRGITSASILSTLVSTADIKEWYNGVEVLTTTSTHYGDNATVITIGSRNDGLTRFTGDWAEIVITFELSDEELYTLEGYLSHKWGVGMPIDHPYKDSAPTV